jgi:non-ribosomal peptide synthetase component F
MRVDAPEIADGYELSPLQHGMLLHSLLDPGAGVYHLHSEFRAENLDVPAFRQAWQRLVARHEALRTSFHWEGRDNPIQVVHPHAEVPVEEQDWRGLSDAEQQQKLRFWLRTDRRRDFVLTRPPLLRVALFRLTDTEHHCLFSLHHLLVDAWSAPLLESELFTLYHALRNGGEATLPPVRPYRDYIGWLKHQDLARAEAFWRRDLEGFTAPTPLPVDRPGRFRMHDDRPEKLTFDVPAELARSLYALARRRGLTINTLLQGAWGLLLSLYSGSDDVVFGVPVSGRPADLPGVENMVGLFVNTLPVRIRVTPDEKLIPWLKQLQDRQAERLQFQHSPLVEIKKWNSMAPDQPLFESLFNFRDLHEQKPWGAGKKEERAGVRQAHQRGYRLAVTINPKEDGLKIRVVYSPSSFEADTIARLIEHFQEVLRGMAADPEQRLRDVSLMSASERRRILVEWNQTAAGYPSERCAHQLFEEQAQRVPRATALSFSGGRLSYADLNRQANRLARRLRRLGAAPGSLVGLCLERSGDAVVALLAVLKSGAAYVPIDPAYPPERIRFLLEDAGVGVLITRQRLVESLPVGTATVLCLDSQREEIAREEADNLDEEASPDDLAYVIYTSGTTGTPRGVQVPHRALVNLLCSMARRPGLTASDTLLAVTTLSFDIAALELLLPLTVGATVALVCREDAAASQSRQPSFGSSSEDSAASEPGWRRSDTHIARLAALLAESGATVLQATPTTWRLLVESGWAGNPRLKALCGGEALPPSLAQALLGRVGELWNMYGPTETTIWSTIHRVDARHGIVPIGKPIANTRVYVLDAQMRPAPIGVVGELHIGGDGVARGYLRQRELTREKFVPDPFSADPAARLYKTGDLCRWLPSGELECLGRSDHQVKLHGFRIEPGEIESVLLRHPRVRAAVVVAREDLPGGAGLAAYVVAQRESAPQAEELRAFLKEHLPGPMTPAAFVFLNELPLTPNGKVDRKALPAPDFHRPERAYVEPHGPVQQTLARIWAEVLRLDQIGATDDFFALGGDSILGIRVAARANEAGVPMMPEDLFQHPTIAGLAEVIQMTEVRPDNTK